MKKNKMKRAVSRGAIRLLDVLIVIFGIIFAISIIIAVVMYNENGEYHYKTSSFNYAMRDSDYVRMVEYANNNRALDYGIGDRDFEEYYAVADYFEAQVYAHMYEKSGDSARATKWSAKADSAKAKMGLLTPEAEKIDERVGAK